MADDGVENMGYMDDGFVGRLNVSPIPDGDCGRLANGSGVAIIGGNAVVNYPQSPTSGEPKEDESEAGSCGYCCWTPTVLQRLASGRFFALFLGLLSLAEAGLTIGYIGSMVTTLELQFRFSSKLTGFVTSCYDIGTLLVILTSYFGGRAAANRPKWIAWSAWVMALGASVVTLPHFFISYDAQGNTTAPSVCYDSHGGGDEPICQSQADQGIESSALFFLIPGMLLIGAGSTATITLGTTYIDDFVRKKETPILLALVFSSTVVGPAVGFLVGSLFASYYVDFDKASESDVKISPSSPLWVGAWWLGFFCFAGLISVLAFPVFAFPAKLEKPKAIVQDSDASGNKGGDDDDANVRMAFSDVSLAKIPLAVWGLVTNPVYMMINLSAAAEFSIVTGFVRFAPKFVQSQFGLTATTANLLTGTLIPAGAVGVILGGLVLNRMKSTLLNSMTVLTTCTILSWLLYGAVYIPGPCLTSPLAGVTTPYRKGDSNWHAPSDPFNVNLTSDCNAPCQCDVTKYRPICSSVDVSYFSPCFAGCQHEKSAPTEDYPDGYEFYNCSCVREYNSSGLHESTNAATKPTVIAQAVTGLCEPDCSSLAPFLVLLLLVVFVSSTEQMPALMAVLRCVKKEERPFAIGIQFVIFRLIGFIPSPIYYGAVIDSSCILWERECEGKSGACLLYSNSDFFYRFLWLSTGLKTIAVAMSVVAWIIVRRRHSRRSDFTPSTLPDGSLDSAF